MSSDLQHQTSPGRRRRPRISAPRSNMGRRGWDEKDGHHLLPWQAYLILPIACILHHASFRGIRAHLWSQTVGSRLWSFIQQHKEDKWEILDCHSELKVFNKIMDTFPKGQSVCSVPKVTKLAGLVRLFLKMCHNSQSSWAHYETNPL